MNTLRNVLLADDDADDRMLFRDVLNDLGMAVALKTVGDGVELMELLHASATLPDVLFLDFNMPKKDGLSCLREIKADERLSALPVVVFSNSDNPALVEMMLNEGASYFVRKQHGYNKTLKLITKLFALDKSVLAQKKEIYDFVIHT